MRKRRGIAVAGLSAALVLGTGSVAYAAPAGAGTEPECEVPPDWSSCVQVVASLDRAPAVGATAQLTIEVRALTDIDHARIEADLPAALDWQSRPAGWKLTDLGPLLPEDGDGVQRASRVVDVKAGKTLRYKAKVRGVAAASTSVRARVTGPAASPLDDDANMLLLSVGATAADSYLGLDASRNSDALQALPDTMPLVPSTSQKFRPVSEDGLAEPHSDDPPAGGASIQAITCVTGTVGYEAPAGTGHPSPNIQVQAWDYDSIGADDLLDSALTDDSGSYRLCFDNGTDVSGGQDVYVKMVAENGLWRVSDEGFLGSRDVYDFNSARKDNLANGRTVDYGRLAPADQTLHRVLHSFDMANDAKEWTPGECWDARDTGDCRRMEIVYPDDDSDDVSVYRHSNRTVYLEPATPDDRSDAVHEYGHAVMGDLYEDNWPPSDNCSPHAMDTTSSPGCAWTEGFANWYPMAIYNDDYYRGWRVEDTSSFDPGDATEGRVTGSLWDLIDPGSEGWDNWQESGKDALWDTMLDRRSATFREFWTNRGLEGHNVGDGPAGALFQNGIDYGFRFGLSDGVTLTRPTPETPNNYRYETTYAYWSVVALRPPANVDYDLALYDDAALSQQLATSVLPGDTVDFVAVDSGKRPLGDYYPVVRRPSSSTGTGDYRIQLAAGHRLLLNGATQAMNGADDVVAVWDYCPSAAATTTVTVTPSDASQDAELFLLSSDAANAASWTIGRSQAAAESVGHGPGQPEAITFDQREGCYGVVVVNRAGSGTYTLTLS
ncbi:hypothetical protein GCM10010168_34310 [Actinoplanes ianthinogenes]|uniref:Uncharacterized protein n=1 Tax=Actinoplanes ianthinogenes TaxID=122358 RepID=A0ABM7M623_9ACTN|nr:hypothetical protein [Actinoplanes ianthinogenes]BCJ47049.1 hypothetical protein Aiant_77060 [Actinoplanes ianthinogenes]GGR13648.1 hypothetical protein GCM10010168_34310 [Actinoplanes ianthinogenes]